jgi:MoaA/NifB/PqqE/SkfB family radical SAM enzyme
VCDSLGVPLRFQGPVAPRDNGDLTPLQIKPAEKTWELVTAHVESRREPPPVSDDRRGQSVNADKEEQAMCSVGVAGVDIDPFGNVQACMHLQTAAGNLHEQSIKDIWDTSPVFQRARKAAVNAALQFADSSPKQYGAPVFCIAVEENANKGCGSLCSKTCG